MTRQVLYVACPLAPTSEEISEYHGEPALAADRALRANLARAMAWLAWLRKSFPETTFIAPWIASVMSGEDDADPAQREAGLVDACAVVERCDGIVLCGGRISSGMRREMEHGMMRRKIWVDPADQPDAFGVHDLTVWEAEAPPKSVPHSSGFTFAEFMRGVKAACR